MYRPFIADAVDEGKLVEDVSRFFGLERCDVEGKLETYRAFHKANGYAQTLGELKTLCFEEAFILGVLLGAWRPRTLVEIGTQHGRSTRRLLDLLGLLGLQSRMVCFDVADEVRHFRRDEAELVLCDAGILAALDRNYDEEVFNLGCGRREELLDFVQLVERCCDKEARKEYLPLQPGDVPASLADISKARRMLSFTPWTTIREGVPRFVDWYRTYHGRSVPGRLIQRRPHFGTRNLRLR